MSDSEDYFDEDLVLDEGTIAALDEVESQFAITQSFVPPPKHPQPAKKPEERPAKRQKTEHVAAVSLKRGFSANNDADLPEISVQGDNGYQVNAPQTVQRGGVVYRPSDSQPHGQRPLARSSSTTTFNRNAGPSQHPNRRPVGHSVNAHPAHTTPNPSRNLHRISSTQQLFGSQSAPQIAQSSSIDQKARRDAEILRVKLEELEKNQAELQRKLREAEDTRFTREGEISILRASIAKDNEQHASEVAKLQAAREAAEAAKAQLQKDQREELERLKTHYTFRQHELETSTRKPPWSASRKTHRMEPNTPVKMPSQMLGWNTGNNSDFPFAQTPRGPRFGAIEKQPSQRPRQIPSLAENSKQKPSLPGFHNSFFDTPSKYASQRVVDKGKGKQRAKFVNDNPFLTGHSHSSPPSSPLAHPEPFQDDVMDLEPAGPSNMSSPPRPTQRTEDLNDVDMDIRDDAEMQDEIEDYDPPNWRDELQHVIFTHTLPSSNIPTMQVLLNASIPPNTPQEQLNLYTTACSRLLEKLGSTPLPVVWEDHLREISTIFADLARILNDNAILYPLTSLFSLLRILSYIIPSFSAALLTSTPNDTPPPILLIICDTIVTHIAGCNTGKPREDVDTLAKEALSFVETLALTGPSELIPQLSTIIRGPGVLSTLLHKDRPTWLIAHTAHMLGVLASYGTLFRALITHPLPAPGEDDKPAEDISGGLPHIEALSWALVDPTRERPDADSLREQIITFIAILALAHSDALTILLQSHMLVHSVITYLSNETEGFWEDDDALISSPTKLDRVLRIISRTIALLYYMVFITPEPYRLGRKLHFIPSRHFHGTRHIFNVTMGRFSFADSPCWLNDADRAQYEQTVDMAKDLLELVMEGPELDEVWSAFQPDNVTDDDDEEQEARMLHPDNDN